MGSSAANPSYPRRVFNAMPAPLKNRLRRLRVSLVPIVQCALAAGVSWWIAVEIFIHPDPFFAPIAAVISLGLSLGQRWRRAAELVGGVAIGILVGDLFISLVGEGAWQIMIVVALAMTVAVFLDDGPLVPMQAASSAALVATLLPPGGVAGFHRALDALIGGLVGILVGALLPVNPASRARRDAAGVLATVRDAARQLATGLRERDEELIAAALEAGRGTQAEINKMRSDMTGGREVTRISPLYWGSRMRLDRISATADPIDNAVRNFRIIARRSLGMTQRGGAGAPRIDRDHRRSRRRLRGAARDDDGRPRRGTRPGRCGQGDPQHRAQGPDRSGHQQRVVGGCAARGDPLAARRPADDGGSAKVLGAGDPAELTGPVATYAKFCIY